MKTASYRHIFKYTGIFGGVQALNVLVAVVRNKLTAFFIGAVGMGLADLLSRTVTLFSTTADLGIPFSGVRHLSELHEQGDRRAIDHYVCLIRSWMLGLALLGTAICAVCLPLVSRLTIGDYSATMTYVWVAPAIGMSVVWAGELALLRGLRQLGRLGRVSAFGALGTLVVTAPLYAWLGLDGVVPVVVLTIAVQMAIALYASTRLCPYRIVLTKWRFIGQGRPLLTLGLAYVGAAFLGALAELGIRAFISQSGSLQAVGFYSAGFTLTASYARLIFTAMDADYYARLAVAVKDQAAMNVAVNRQTDVLMVLMVPFLIAFALGLPWVVRLLYTDEFLAVMPMTLCAMIYMFFKALFSPAAYLPLASGHARTYFLMEALYDLPFVLLVCLGYLWYGLAGAGIGLALSGAYNLVLVMAVYRRRYGFRPAQATIWRALVCGLWLALGLTAAWQTDPALHWGMGLTALTLSAATSWQLMKKAKRPNSGQA